MKVKIGRLFVLLNQFMNLPQYKNMEIDEMPAQIEEILEREVYIPFYMMQVFACLI